MADETLALTQEQREQITREILNTLNQELKDNAGQRITNTVATGLNAIMYQTIQEKFARLIGDKDVEENSEHHQEHQGYQGHQRHQE